MWLPLPSWEAGQGWVRLLPSFQAIDHGGHAQLVTAYAMWLAILGLFPSGKNVILFLHPDLRVVLSDEGR